MIHLANKVAIVTGAGRGVGVCIAQELGAAGVRVAVNDINPDRAAKTADQIVASGGQAVGIAADVSNKFQCAHLIETTRAEWGQVDILVNNAAVMPQAAILKMDEWDWNRCLEVNLKAPFFMSQLCGRVMADENQKRGGIILNIASTAGVFAPLSNRAAYCASKAGLVGFTRECAREFGAYGIKVAVLTPPENPADEGALSQQIASLVVELCVDNGRVPPPTSPIITIT
ncbi:MAG: SDR family NAD(P)-dependent oxidoreductase [Chloroflexi bacterium]|nr:SDR family NAD(P)-dependent oxidoreductase [Chloroflexota bacterium]